MTGSKDNIKFFFSQNANHIFFAPYIEFVYCLSRIWKPADQRQTTFLLSSAIMFKLGQFFLTYVTCVKAMQKIIS